MGDAEEFRLFKIVEGEGLQTHHVVARRPSEALETFERDIGGDYRVALDHTPLHVEMLRPQEGVEVGYEYRDWMPESDGAPIGAKEGFEERDGSDDERFALYVNAPAHRWAEQFGKVGLLSTTAGF